jgi:predicted Zn-dependent protease with MMP-like domain
MLSFTTGPRAGASPTLPGMDDRHARRRHRVADPRRRPVDGYRLAGGERFDRLVGEVLAELPGAVLDHLQQVELRLADVPPTPAPGEIEEVLLARYEPAGPTGRAIRTPARLTLYRRPIEARAHSKPELIALLREVLVRETARQLGIDDDGLEDLGWL